MSIVISDYGRLNLFEEFENRVPYSYDDYNGKRVYAGGQCIGTLTIGVGHTKGVYKGQTATDEQINAWFAQDTLQACYDLERLVKVPLTQNQADAIADLIFNVGAGAFGKSKTLQMLNAGDYTGCANALLTWNKVKNSSGQLVVSNGLTRRCQARYQHFLEGIGVLAYVYNGSGTSKGVSTGAKIRIGALAVAALNALS